MPVTLPRLALPAAMLAAGLSLTPGTARAQDSGLTSQQEEAVRALIEETLRERPEIIVEALQDLQRREEAAAAERQRQSLERLLPALEDSPVLPVMGNPDGAVTMVEFFDYQCPHCRSVAPTVAAAIEENDDLRVVLIETPVLGEASQLAARAAIAATAQGDEAYLALHEALMSEQGRLSEAVVFAAAERAGLDAARLREDMQADFVTQELARSMALAREVGLRGTPFFVIGGESAPGAIGGERMQEMIDQARSQG